MIGRRSLYAIMAAMLTAAYADGAPSRMRPVCIAGPDGTPVTVVAVGDESNHHFITADGTPVEWLPMVAGAKKMTRQMGRRSMAARADWSDGDDAAMRESLVRRPPKDGRYLVLLVDFPDRGFKIPDAGAEFHDMLNTEGYANYAATGSVRDYFADNSSGLFLPVFDVVGPVTMPSPAAAYASSGSDDSPAGLMLTEACRMIDGEVDFSVYDTDNDGTVDNVYIFYAGKGQADGGDQTTIWPHSWNLTDQGRALVLDGVKIDTYACSPELDGADKINGIGTFCHEFSHVLGLPDLYGSGANHPAKYSLMASGNYNNDGRTPPNFSAFERFCLGWLEPRDLVHPKSVELEPIAANEAWRIPTGRVNEFFLLENRQTDGWDIDIPGHGLLVWHIDYNPDIWERNMVNRNNGHQYVDIVEANGGTSASQAAGFTFPGAGRKTSLTAETYPALRDWAGNAIDMPLTSITETPEGTVKFDAKGGKAEVGGVAGLTVETISPVEIAVAWQATAGAEAYEVMVRTQGGTIGEAVAFMTVHTTSANVGGLKPGGSYDVSVAARDEFEIGRPSAVTVVMPDGTLEFMAPEFAGVTDVTDTGFSLEWLPLGGATYYELTVAEIVPGELTAVKTGFDGKAIPDGWWLDGTTWISAPGNYATSAPALRFEAEGSSLTIDAGKKVRSVSFWCRGTKVTPGSCIAVEISDGASWQQAASVAIPAEATTAVAEIPAVLAGNTGLVRLRFVKDGSCTAAIDDIVVTAGDEVEAVLPEWDARDTGNTLSAVVYGLKPSTDYLCTIAGKSGEQRSLSSKPLRVSTKSFSGIGDIPTEPAAGMVAVAFITPDGRVYSLGTNMPKGICIVRYADGSVRKLLIR